MSEFAYIKLAYITYLAYIYIFDVVFHLEPATNANITLLLTYFATKKETYFRGHIGQSLWRDSTSQYVFSELGVLAVFKVVDSRPETILVSCLWFAKLLENCFFNLFSQVLWGIDRVINTWMVDFVISVEQNFRKINIYFMKLKVTIGSTRQLSLFSWCQRRQWAVGECRFHCWFFKFPLKSLQHSWEDIVHLAEQNF